MFLRLLTSAAFAGAGAGLLAAVLQLLFLQPVLLEAELYESGALTHFGGVEASGHDHGGGEDAEGHDHSDPTVPHDHPLPGDGGGRDLMNVVFSIAIYIGYALILAAGMVMAEARGAVLDPARGVAWGLAGFAAFQLAPAFSLAPELPGSAAADVEARQIWWFATVAVTALALWLAAFQRGLAWLAAAVALALAPHLIGAPQPGGHTGPTPPEVAALFAARALTIGALAWALAGALAAYFLTRDEDGAGA